VDAGKAKWDCRLGVIIPLRDGVQLNATVYLPPRQVAPAPCIVLITPYISDNFHDRGSYFATHGYPFAVVDARGRGNSEGTFRPFVQEAQDGYDVVEWVAGQDYCNGKVAMWGGSYSGSVQWATAKEAPPHLATIVPVAAAYLGLDFPMRSNIFYPSVIQWLAFTMGRTLQAQLYSDNSFWSALYRQWHESGRAFRDLDSMFGSLIPMFQEWIDHPEPDGYWATCNPTAMDYAKLTVPILTITGSYDDDQPGALEHYCQHVNNAPEECRSLHYLVIGPWDHAGTRTPAIEVGGVRFGANSLLDLPKLHIDWYGWTISGKQRPDFLRRRVAYYVMGADEWRYADTLTDVTAHFQAFFLHSMQHSINALPTGGLRQSSGEGDPDVYRYDPRETSGPEVAAEAKVTVGSLIDQTVLSALVGRALIYESEPLDQNTEISGCFRLSAWISIDCPDTDFYVSVHEVTSEGTSIRLSTDAMRARYRSGLNNPQLVHTRAPLCYEFAKFTFVSREIKQGSRLRLVLSPVGRLAETMFTGKNYNSGGVVSRETANHARPVTVCLHHDQSHPSVLYVPIGRSKSTNEPEAPRTALIGAMGS
jgi:uncharacterized protein